MKSLFLGTCLLMIGFLNGQSIGEELKGSWTGALQGQSMVLSLLDNGKAEWQIGELFNMGQGQITFNGETQKGYLLYLATEQAGVISIDLIMYNPASGTRFKFPCLGKFLDENTLQFVVGEFRGSRPKDFRNPVILQRTR